MGVVCVLIKYAAESAWCLLLVGRAGPSDRIVKAMSFGFVRLLIGREAMLVVSNAPVFPWGEIVLYGVLLVGRWFVWGLLVYIRSRSRDSPGSELSASVEGIRARRWRLGGVLVSCLADVPALLTGLWVGLLWL